MTTDFLTRMSLTDLRGYANGLSMRIKVGLLKADKDLDDALCAASSAHRAAMEDIRNLERSLDGARDLIHKRENAS